MKKVLMHDTNDDYFASLSPLNEPGCILQWQIQLVIWMPFSLATISTVVSAKVVHYSSIIHYHHLKTQLNEFQNPIHHPSTSIEIKYYQEIEFLIKLWKCYIMVIEFTTYFRFVYGIKLQYMLKDNSQRFLYLFIHWNSIKLVCFCKVVP